MFEYKRKTIKLQYNNIDIEFEIEIRKDIRGNLSVVLINIENQSTLNITVNTRDILTYNHILIDPTYETIAKQMLDMGLLKFSKHTKSNKDLYKITNKIKKLNACGWGW